MAGKIRTMIDSIMEQRAQGNPVLLSTTKTKLLLKGIRVDDYTSSSEDDPAVIEKLIAIAKDLNIDLERSR